MQINKVQLDDSKHFIIIDLEVIGFPFFIGIHKDRVGVDLVVNVGLHIGRDLALIVFITIIRNINSIIEAGSPREIVIDRIVLLSMANEKGWNMMRIRQSE